MGDQAAGGRDERRFEDLDIVLLHDIVTPDAEAILRAGRELCYEPGEAVYRQGDNRRSFFLVVEGVVELTINPGNRQQVVVGHIGAGGHFGETSLLTDVPNGATASALTSLTLLCYDAEQFRALFLSNPAIHNRLSATLAKRLRVSFIDHARSLGGFGGLGSGGYSTLDSAQGPGSPSAVTTADKILDTTYLSSEGTSENSFFQQRGGLRNVESSIARQRDKALRLFAGRCAPLLILGESGTGRRLVAHEIHLATRGRLEADGPYAEIDVRAIPSESLMTELCGYERDAAAFAQVANLGLLERTRGGTLVLYNSECLAPESQEQLAGILRGSRYRKEGSGPDRDYPLQTRLILICRDDNGQENGADKLLPELVALFAEDQFRVAPLRKHRRDIPRLVDFYLKRFNQQYGKEIPSVDEQTLAMFINYDWPGNLVEMSSVMQRAVIIGKDHVPLRHRTMLGMPRPEGKWEFNLLRLPLVKRFLTSRFFPKVARVLVGIFLVVLLGLLLLGPEEPEANLGLTLSWIVGWPLLIFAFFFFARIWCSICGLSVPGWLAQHLFKPKRPTPQFLRRFSGWIMTGLCLTLFWVEITWNAYESSQLTAGIILAVTSGSLLFSMFFKRRVWCRYLCPLGAINALFSMPSVLELRANTHMCMNRCADYACYSGDDGENGCPMFRHPFLVDNNRDCILCGQCIKNCKLNSVQLNVRLAPQELWNQQAPRLADSVLVISLAAVFFPFIVKQQYAQWLSGWLPLFSWLPEGVREPVVTTLFFAGCVSFYLAGYAGLSLILSRLTAASRQQTGALLGYGMIPLVLGAFMAAHLEIFVAGIHRLPENLAALFGCENHFLSSRLLDQDATAILQLITICGALIASLYATHRIMQRLTEREKYPARLFWLPGSLLCVSAICYFLLL